MKNVIASHAAVPAGFMFIKFMFLFLSAEIYLLIYCLLVVSHDLVVCGCGHFKL